ncbi:hypothetical protein M569_17132 [Genlisea aurea]|uniref:Uncharacterized protein n=1 Tax=Genlisea aurea TaxID=192259 RepID=S8BSV8_9LAMI|nr:hypothetical protein M569_17132 [Genlisea aurea]
MYSQATVTPFASGESGTHHPAQAALQWHLLWACVLAINKADASIWVQVWGVGEAKGCKRERLVNHVDEYKDFCIKIGHNMKSANQIMQQCLK